MQAGEPFEQWLIKLYNVVYENTGLSAYEVIINPAEAKKWYDDGFTPYQCFREVWGAENDAGLYSS